MVTYRDICTQVHPGIHNIEKHTILLSHTHKCKRVLSSPIFNNTKKPFTFTPK